MSKKWIIFGIAVFLIFLCVSIIVYVICKSSVTEEPIVNSIHSTEDIGQQMFQIATLLGISYLTNVPISLGLLPKQFPKDVFPIVNGYVQVDDAFNKLFQFDRIPTKEEKDQYNTLTHHAKNKHNYQNEDYFMDSNLLIHRMFTPRHDLLESIHVKLPKSKNMIGVHISKNIPISFYKLAIQTCIHDILKNNIQDDDYTVVLFGDTPLLLSNENMITYPSNEQWEILIALSLCNYQVLSDSSIAWWSSFLNVTNRKLTISPHQNKEYIHRANWNTIIDNELKDSLLQQYIQPIVQKCIPDININVNNIMNIVCFIISMKPDRYNHCYDLLTNTLKLTNVNHFNAVIGKNISMEECIKHKLITTHLLKDQSSGAIGCLLSHVAIWYWFYYETNLPFLIVFEDDIKLDDRVNSTVFQNYIQQSRLDMDPNWAILYLGSCGDNCKSYIQINDKNPWLKRTVRSHCTHSYMISRLGALAFLNHTPYHTAIDTNMADIYESNSLYAYSTNPSLFWQDVEKWQSTIRSETNANILQCW